MTERAVSAWALGAGAVLASVVLFASTLVAVGSECARWRQRTAASASIQAAT